ncbi:MAG: RelA/SpoT family protein [Patescibacteria group bacterium]|jgi:GTP pyrophosphokinase
MIKELEQKLLNSAKYLGTNGQNALLGAIAFAKKQHRGQKRRTGEPYISHPLSVAFMLAEQKFDLETIIGALLHDTLEDGKTSFDEIKKEFGTNIAGLVEGVTKISNIKLKELTLDFDSDDIYEGQVDTYRKLLLAMAKDIRVIIIKLFDRYHNAQTFSWLPPQKREFYARETIDIYAQIAERIGIGRIKSELEDLSFQFAYPDEYEEYQTKFSKLKIKENLIDQKIKEIRREFSSRNLKPIDIYGRVKHSYSTYRKLKYSYDWNIERFYDLYAIRVIVNSVEDCYRALGIVHSIYTPIPGTFDDYIAKPRANGYQSLHSALHDDNGNAFEIQFRTPQMHEVAEYGMAAHWHYKDLVNAKNEHAIKQSHKEWARELKNLHRMDDKKQFVSHLKDDLFAEKIFVFTPKGKIINLPVDSTPVDFAYAIHSTVGDRCFGAKLNGRMIPLDSKLKNGDIIEIITSAKARPSVDWLSSVKTSGAKQKIRRYLREANRDLNIVIGRRAFNEAIEEFKLPRLDDGKLTENLKKSRLPYKNLDDAFVAFSEKMLSKVNLLKAVYPSFTTTEICEVPREELPKGIDSLRGVKYVYAGCCRPSSPENAFGYIGKDHVIKIHKRSCKFLKKADEKRVIEI